MDNLRLDGNTLSTISGNLSLLPDGEVLLKADPVSALGAATKSYVDSVAGGLDFKNSVRVKTVAALPSYTQVGTTLTANSVGAIGTIDGVTLNVGDRILVTSDGTVNDADNGIYTVVQLGNSVSVWILIRATDADDSSKLNTGAYVFVEEGNTCAGSSYVLETIEPIIIGTTPLNFVQFSSAAQINAINVGTGGVGVFKQKNGNALEFKNIVGGANIVVTDNTDEIDIDVGSDVVTATGLQTLTNKSIVGATNNVEAAALLHSTGAVAVNAATAPTNGQVLTATGGTTAIWQSPAVTQYFYAYDVAGNITVTSAWTDLTWDTNPKTSTPFTFTPGTAEITIGVGGDYLINLDVNIKATASNSRTGAEMRMVRDTGSGYLEIPGTRGITYERMNNYGASMSISSMYITLNSGDKIKVQADRTIGSATIKTLPNGCRLSIRTAY